MRILFRAREDFHLLALQSGGKQGLARDWKWR
jgi:hypothetical protein